MAKRIHVLGLSVAVAAIVSVAGPAVWSAYAQDVSAPAATAPTVPDGAAVIDKVTPTAPADIGNAAAGANAMSGDATETDGTSGTVTTGDEAAAPEDATKSDSASDAAPTGDEAAAPADAGASADAAPAENPASAQTGSDESAATSTAAPAAATATQPGVAATHHDVSGAEVAQAAGLNSVFHATSHDGLFAITFRGSHGWAVGEHGLLVTTEDGGQTWAVQPKMIDGALLAIDMPDDQHGVIVGQSGVIFVTTDGGKTWKRAQSDAKDRLFSVSINSQGFGVAVGEFGAYLRTRDFGQTWEKVKEDWTTKLGVEQDPHLYVVNVTDKDVTIAGEFGIIARSVDEGNTWRVLHRGDESIFNFHLASDGTRGMAVGQEGMILKTNDGGNTWQRLKSPTGNILLDVWSGPEGEAVITGIHVILRSHDGGQNWQIVNAGDFSEFWYQAIAAGQVSTEVQSGKDDTGAQVGPVLTVSQTKVYAVGQDASILSIEE